MRYSSRKKDFKTEYELYWDRYWADRRNFWVRYRTGKREFLQDRKAGPKLKRNKFYPKEYNMYNKDPKWWRKCFDIRPKRARSKRYTKSLEKSLLNVNLSRWFIDWAECGLTYLDNSEWREYQRVEEKEFPNLKFRDWYW